MSETHSWITMCRRHLQDHIGRLLQRPACRTHPANVSREVLLTINDDVTPVVDRSTFRSAEVVLWVYSRCNRYGEHSGNTDGGKVS